MSEIGTLAMGRHRRGDRDGGSVAYARDVLRLSYVVSAILPQNARSRRVAERFGARADGQMEVVGVPWDRGHVVKITLAPWLDLLT